MTMTKEAPVAAAAPATAWHGLTPEAALAELGVNQAVGLTGAEVEARRAKYGPNKFAEAPK